MDKPFIDPDFGPMTPERCEALKKAFEAALPRVDPAAPPAIAHMGSGGPFDSVHYIASVDPYTSVDTPSGRVQVFKTDQLKDEPGRILLVDTAALPRANGDEFYEKLMEAMRHYGIVPVTETRPAPIISLHTGVGGKDMVDIEIERQTGKQRRYLGRKVMRIVRRLHRNLRKDYRGRFYVLDKIK